MEAIFAASEPVTIPVVTNMSLQHRSEDYPRYIGLDESRKAYEPFEKKVKQQLINEKKAEFPPEVIEAYDAPEEQRKLAAPLIKAIESLFAFDSEAGELRPNLEKYLTPREKDEYENLIRRIANAVLRLPIKDGSHKLYYDGLFDSPSATVLGHIEPQFNSGRTCPGAGRSPT